jgi:hypothetical protein
VQTTHSVTQPLNLNVRRESAFLLLATIDTPRGVLPYSWSWVDSCGIGIDNMMTLSALECGSHLYGSQNFEVYLYPTRSEYEAKKMTWVDQELWARSALPPGEGECHCGCAESQGSLQLLASYEFSWRGVQHPSVTGFVIVQYHHHNHSEEWDHCSAKEWWRHESYQEKNARWWPKGRLLTRISSCGTTLHGLEMPKEGSAMTRPTIQKISEDHGVLHKA